MPSLPERQPPKKIPAPLNGINTPALFATIDVVKQQPQLGAFQFRAQRRVAGGNAYADHDVGVLRCRRRTQPQGSLHRRCGPSGSAVRRGQRRRRPVEYVLHALAACLTAGIANIAAARGVTLHSVTSSLEGDIDLRGILGLSKEVRNGFSAMRVSFTIKGDAPETKLREIVEQACARSAVLDILSNGVPISVETDT